MVLTAGLRTVYKPSLKRDDLEKLFLMDAASPAIRKRVSQIPYGMDNCNNPPLSDQQHSSKEEKADIAPNKISEKHWPSWGTEFLNPTSYLPEASSLLSIFWSSKASCDAKIMHNDN